MNDEENSLADELQRASTRFQSDTERTVKRLIRQQVADQQLNVLDFNLSCLLPDRLEAWIRIVVRILNRHYGNAIDDPENVNQLYKAASSEIDLESRRLDLLLQRLWRQMERPYFTTSTQQRWLREDRIALRRDLRKERDRALRAAGKEMRAPRLSGERNRNRNVSFGGHEAGPLPTEKRAELVAKLINELKVLRPQISSEEDYADQKRRHRDFLCFQIAQEYPKLKEKIFNLQFQRSYIRLAQELTAAHSGTQLSTVQKDWKKHKPPVFRRLSKS
jgi:hypothetical protein